MNERDLKYFCHLVETGNYTATSKQFGVTQPAISAAVKRLETQYGTTLLTQFNHRAKLVVTPAGQVLYVKARKIIREISQVELEVKHANERQVRLGFSNVAGGIWLPRMIERFVKNNLLDQITTTVADSEKLLDDLRNGKLDAAVFSTIQPEQSADLQVTQLETRQLSLLVNVNHPLSKLREISPKDLKEVPLIARYKKTIPRMALDQFCFYRNVKPTILYEAATNQLVEAWWPVT
ncbi:LysR family transcriptional regulator [Lentilactobacillus parafarraginis]|uniref:LysR family transcriptional regulator n=1 Tax=Lentilactobacillus parafarraginis TaxID=390842 RepID=UPI000A9D8A59|nr:LysR family transcriptional regulator [Lentilactobacillus parafarraginis]